MNKEFHYDVIYVIAEKAGYSREEAFIIASCSQLVDDNAVICEVEVGDDIYANYVSQTINIFKPVENLLRIYSIFHFIPGDYLDEKTTRTDGSLHTFNCTPGSSNASKLLKKAIESENLYLIGVTLHAYADTYSHQNFVGLKHVFNQGLGFWDKLIPSIGHVDYRTKPDAIGKNWVDKRLAYKEVDYRNISNNERFMDAAKDIFYMLYTLSKDNDVLYLDEKWEELEKILSVYFSMNKKDRESYMKVSLGVPEYNPYEWRDQAVKKQKSFLKRMLVGITNLLPPIASSIYPKGLKVEKFEGEDDFYESHWYLFQEAIKEYQEEALELIKDRYEHLSSYLKEIW